jgi:membrane protein insertase Oxa1/YidC/SpoIIIJ
MSLNSEKVFKKMREKKEAEAERRRVMAENKALHYMEKQNRMTNILMKILPIFTFILFPFAAGALLMAVLVFMITDSLTLMEFFQVLQKDYSFTGLWSIGYAIISTIILISLILFFFRPKK